MTNYTKAPWYVASKTAGGGYSIRTKGIKNKSLAHNNEDAAIGYVTSGRATENHVKANAYLVAAAPELYEALVIAERFVAAEIALRNAESGEGTSTALDKIRAAIAKATA